MLPTSAAEAAPGCGISGAHASCSGSSCAIGIQFHAAAQRAGANSEGVQQQFAAADESSGSLLGIAVAIMQNQLKMRRAPTAASVVLAGGRRLVVQHRSSVPFEGVPRPAGDIMAALGLIDWPWTPALRPAAQACSDGLRAGAASLRLVDDAAADQMQVAALAVGARAAFGRLMASAHESEAGGATGCALKLLGPAHASRFPSCRGLSHCPGSAGCRWRRLMASRPS